MKILRRDRAPKITEQEGEDQPMSFEKYQNLFSGEIEVTPTTETVLECFKPKNEDAQEIQKLLQKLND